MSLANKIMQKLSNTRYELEFEEYGVSIFLSPMTVEQRQRAMALDDETEQQLLVFVACAYDEDGKPAADSVDEARQLPETVVGVSVAVISLMTQGASHETLDKYVEGYNKEMNPEFEDDETNPNQ